MDRPIVGKSSANREYVQPQWIVDSLNNLHLLPTHQYKPGMAPPPHLSPFVDDAKEGYLPTRLKEIHALKGEEIDDLSEEEELEIVEPPKKELKAQKGAKP